MSGWGTPEPDVRRPWYVLVAIGVISAIAIGSFALIGLVVFFGLIGGW